MYLSRLNWKDNSGVGMSENRSGHFSPGGFQCMPIYLETADTGLFWILQVFRMPSTGNGCNGFIKHFLLVFSGV
ncbi:hypothetical protein CSA37_03495 [Candidatus Fermentibacteria bacterium]|nr:MAG: hypothetical protein CSA37_03495 [Candidatus Fermentibacteria bacterium]